MMELLGQVNWEQAGVMLGGIVVALGGQRGIERLIVAWRVKRQNGSGPRFVREEICVLRHQEQQTRQDERHQAVLNGLAEVKGSLGKVHERIDKLVECRRG